LGSRPLAIVSEVRSREAGSEPPSPGFVPVRLDDVEVGGPLPSLPTSEPGSDTVFGGSMCLVRLHGEPLGIVDLELPPDGLAPAALAAAIEAELGEEIAAHLRADGLEPETLGPAGAGAPEAGAAEAPPCERERLDFLDRAPTATVVICTRDRPDSVRTTLGSILACRYPASRWEIVVVDNAAEGDAVVDLVEREFRGEVPVRAVREPEPGLSHARNRGLAAANGEIVVFADDDVLVDRDWLLRLTAAFEAGDRVGASSGLTLPEVLATPTQRWTEGFGGRVGDFGQRVFDLDDPPPDRPLFPFTVGELGAGRNMAFRREALVELGGFDVALGPGAIAHDGDDIEALLRTLLSGRQIAHDPKAIVWHAHPEDYAELEQRVWGYGVGYTACLTRALIDHPGLALDLVRKLPRGLRFAVSPGSDKNAGRQEDFPRPLVRSEVLGMAYGPLAYLRSRRDQRRRRRRRARGKGPAAKEPSSPGRAPDSLKLLFVCDEYPPVVGGAARNLQLLVERLSPRHEVVVATAWQPNAPGFERMNGVAVHRVRDTTTRAAWVSSDPYRHHAPPFPDPEATLRLRRLIDAEAPDLVYAYGWIASSAAVALRGRDVPLVLSVHDYGNFCAQFTLVRKGETCSGPAALKCLDCARTTYGPAKGAVAVGSVFASHRLLRRGVAAVHGVSGFAVERNVREIGLDGTPAVAIPNFNDGLDEAPAGPLPEGAPSEPFILFVGHLRQYKGLHELLDAYGRLADPPPLVLVGTRGPDTPEEFPPGVTVLTYMPHEAVMALWERALFGVSPSIAPEAFPTVVHEAMSRGKPVIGSAVGGYLDLIEDGGNGLLVPPGDAAALAEAMARLLGDEALRARMGETARERARELAPEAVVPRIERLFRDTVAASRSGR
jgi:glycosyltransferase involved in cell wall biosynthesis/GT2 family glycosyltransferase